MVTPAMTASALAPVRSRDYRRGAWLVTGATLSWSSAGLLARAVQTDAWTTLFWRSLFAAVTLLAYLALRERGRLVRSFRRLGAVGTAMAVCFAVSMICFINGLQLTSVAAVLIFQAASPLFAAAMAWLFLKERIGLIKFVAILGTLGGVAVMVSGSGGGGGLVGDALSALMGISFAATIVFARVRPDVPTSAACCLAVLMVAVVSLPFASLVVTPREMALLAVFGVAQMGLALILFTAGVRLIPAADAGLISVLECVLAPLWVWLAMGEDPGRDTIAGGVIVVLAVVAAALSERRVSP